FKDDRLVARHMGGFQRWLVASPELLARHPVKHPSDLANVHCLTFRGDRPGATWRFKSPQGETNVEVTGQIAVRSFGVLLQLALAGQGFAFLPSFMVEEELKAGRLVRCFSQFQSPEAQVYLTFRPGTRRIARAAAVIEAAEELVPRLLAS
ncbi:MAG: substrate binding domain-containing protein, partial [Pseudomonadota bacterium]